MGRPSDSVVRGDACAPQRSLFYALGLTAADRCGQRLFRDCSGASASG